MEPNFVIGQIYRRRELHELYGGGYQSGISTSARLPIIFIFSGPTGHAHGYSDRWLNDDVYSYTGEGQVNDMDFVRGNKALRDHVKNGKRVFLFVQAYKGHYYFEGELIIEDIDYFEGLDTMNKPRVAIVFYFKRIGRIINLPNTNLSSKRIEEAKKYIKESEPSATEKRGLVTSRIGQGAYRKSVLYRWNYKCAITSYNKNEILIASHIVPWKDSNDQERLDVENSILLSPTYDALFDRHLISFENNGKIILSDIIKNTKYQNIGVSGHEKISNFKRENLVYLDRHRDLFQALHF